MCKNPISILKKYWGFSNFRGSQEKIIHAVLEQRDTLALLPTGGGKSACFQIPALAQEGICIVVSPLLALIHDQVNNLKEKGIKAIALTGGIRFGEVINLLDNCCYGNYKFLYLSPERLQQELVQQKIQEMNVNLIAIDEAHCISQWGHDFRPAYLECVRLRTLLPDTPIIALTATATKRVAQDIVTNLHFTNALVVKDSFSRPNIAFKVVWEEDKRYRLKQLCAKTDKSIIIYVRTRRLTQELAQFLNANSFTADYFHGGISKKEKQEKLNRWLSDKVKIMIATNAFGMGVDKPDVRLIVHYQIPDCLENYFQEAGRAGRDGEPAQAVLLTNKSDEGQLKNRFLGVLPNTAFLKKIYHKLNNYFQIAYGEGTDENYQFNFNNFISVYGLNSFLAYNALRILDQHSVIALSESFSEKTTVHFVCSKQQLFGYLENNVPFAPTVQTILRTYGGIFDFETKINTLLISKKANVTESKVLDLLERLQKDEIIAYQSQNSDMDLTFLVPREDNRTINVFAREVEALNKIKVDKVSQMLKYIHSENSCRSKQILKYFGEDKLQDCGICDVCLRRKSFNTVDSNILGRKISGILKVKPKTSRALIQILDIDDKIVLGALRKMLENGIIKVNDKNEYEIQ